MRGSGQQVVAELATQQRSVEICAQVDQFRRQRGGVLSRLRVALLEQRHGELLDHSGLSFGRNEVHAQMPWLHAHLGISGREPSDLERRRSVVTLAAAGGVLDQSESLEVGEQHGADGAFGAQFISAELGVRWCDVGAVTLTDRPISWSRSGPCRSRTRLPRVLLQRRDDISGRLVAWAIGWGRIHLRVLDIACATGS